MNTTPITTLPDKNLIHEKVVVKIEDRQKEFDSHRQGCRVRSYIVYFEDGYCAEVLFPIGKAPHGFNSAPQKTAFRIGYRKGAPTLDEIEFIASTPNKILSMNGHPSAIALHAACNLMQNSGASYEHVIEYADAFTDWLISKQY